MLLYPLYFPAHGSLALTPISTMDTNCIEDYLKMIESMQSEQQIQQQSTYAASTSTKTNQVHVQQVQDLEVKLL